MGEITYKQPLPFRHWITGKTGGNALISTYWQEYLKRDPNLNRLTTCIEIVFSPDQRIFVATHRIKATSSTTGDAYQYIPVLSQEPEVSSSIEIGNTSSRARSFSIKIPNEFADVSKLLRSGRYLAGFAEVSLQYDGGDYDHRIVLMRGEMDNGVTFYPK